MQITEEDIISGDKFLSLQSYKVNYIKTDLLTNNLNSMNWRGKIHFIRPSLTWITGHSDYPITEVVFNNYEQNCSHWFTVNKYYEHPKLTALPLGITNNVSESELHENTQLIMDVMGQPKTDKNLVYMNFSIDTYPSDRQSCYDTFKDKPWVTVGILEGRRSFLQEIRNHTFVLCPRGNGLDTHRLWETLYMGSIPIVKRHIGLNEFTDLPILFIDDWSDVTEEKLRATAHEFATRQWNLEKLKFSYWKKRILSQV